MNAHEVAKRFKGGSDEAQEPSNEPARCDGTINGCYRTSLDDQKGQLRVVDDPSSCRSNEAAIQWNQEGPKGDTGEQGIQGEKGDKGENGAAGTNGAAGAAGPKGEPCLSSDPACVGPKGDKGDPGTNGTNGSNGADGVDGAAGAPGDPCLPTNPACVGPKGDPGAKGDTGATGPKGDPGPAGPATDSLMGTIAVSACPTTQTFGCLYLAAPVGFSQAFGPLNGLGDSDITFILQTHPFSITTPAVATTGSALAANGPAPGSANGSDRHVDVRIRVVNGLLIPCRISGTQTSCIGTAPPDHGRSGGEPHRRGRLRLRGLSRWADRVRLAPRLSTRDHTPEFDEKDQMKHTNVRTGWPRQRVLVGVVAVVNFGRQVLL